MILLESVPSLGHEEYNSSILFHFRVWEILLWSIFESTLFLTINESVYPFVVTVSEILQLHIGLNIRVSKTSQQACLCHHINLIDILINMNTNHWHVFVSSKIFPHKPHLLNPRSLHISRVFLTNLWHHAVTLNTWGALGNFYHLFQLSVSINQKISVINILYLSFITTRITNILASVSSSLYLSCGFR